jgi:hypothetical protein
LEHPLFIRHVALKRRNITDLQNIKVHSQKERNFGDTIKGRLSSRTTSKSRFKVILGQHATKKGTSTPNKPLDNPTWTIDEGEEMCRDINDL